MSKRIPLTQGKYAIVDDEDFEHLNKYKWCAVGKDKHCYASRTDYSGGKKKNVLMHRIIMKCNLPDIVDHINHDTLDNRKENLRVCSHAENIRNQLPRTNSTSRFKGVSWHKNYGKWRATIRVNGSLINIGCYLKEKEAAKAYNDAAKKYFGEFCLLNDLI